MLSNNYVDPPGGSAGTQHSYGNYSRNSRGRKILRPQTSSHALQKTNSFDVRQRNGYLYKKFEDVKLAYDKPAYHRISKTPKARRTGTRISKKFDFHASINNGNSNRMRSTGQNIMANRRLRREYETQETKESTLTGRLRTRPKTTNTNSLYNGGSAHLMASPMNSNKHTSQFSQPGLQFRRRKNTNTRTEKLAFKQANRKERLDLYGNARKGTSHGTKISIGSVDKEQKDEPIKTRRKKTYLLKKNIKNGGANQDKQPAVPSTKSLQYPLKPMEKQIVTNTDGEDDNKSGMYFASNSASYIASKESSNTFATVTPNQLIGGHVSGVVSLQGVKPNKPGWLNQDNALEVPDFGRQGLVALLGVFDGHGKEGRAVSTFCVSHLSQTLKNADIKPPFTPLVGQRLTQAFLDMDSQLRSNVNTANSGSTAVVLVLSASHILLAHVGDSRACVGRGHNQINQTQRNAPVPEVMALTSDHKPERPDECERVNNNGGRVGPSPHNAHVDPSVATQRVWSADPLYYGPGLAVSRSFGDSVAHTCGVTTIPEVRLYKIQPYDKWLCIATDGVWDVLSLGDVSNIINSIASRTLLWNPKQAARVIVATARRRWRASPQANGRIDDITAMVVRLNNREAR
eukprot:g15439.t1